MTNVAVALHSPLGRLGTWPNFVISSHYPPGRLPNRRVVFLRSPLGRLAWMAPLRRFRCILNSVGRRVWLGCGGSLAFSARSGGNLA